MSAADLAALVAEAERLIRLCRRNQAALEKRIERLERKLAEAPPAT